jgi:hypothetical protein
MMHLVERKKSISGAKVFLVVTIEGLHNSRKGFMQQNIFVKEG